jgi:uncharacterized membrane protein
MTGTMFTVVLLTATLFTALVAGLLFAFALITMPGIRKLGDREFIRAFQVMDGIIQNNHPLFILVWGGSALLLLVAVALGSRDLSPALWIALTTATGAYLLGVQLPTVTINVPLNNALQGIDVKTATKEEIRSARLTFEERWNRWNRRRTVVASVVTAALLLVLAMLR